MLRPNSGLQVLNVMDSYGCSAGFRTPHVDRLLIMCNHNFYNENWADDRDPDTPDPATTIAINHTGPTGCERPDTFCHAPHRFGGCN